MEHTINPNSANDPPRVTSDRGGTLIGDDRDVASGVTDRFAEQWFLRIDDKQYGPLSRSQMEFFLRPPRLCSMMQVMCSVQEGVWHSIARHETIDKVLSKFGIDPEPPIPVIDHANTTPVAPWYGNSIESLRDLKQSMISLFARFRTESLFILAIIGVNAGYLYFTSDGLGRERQILKRYESIWESARQFDPDDDASKAEWREFADEAVAEVESLVQEQEQKQVFSTERQRLLFIGREQLLAILKGATPAVTDSRAADNLNGELKKARELLIVK